MAPLLRITTTKTAARLLIAAACILVVSLIGALFIAATTPSDVGHSGAEVAVSAFSQTLTLQQAMNAVLQNISEAQLALATAKVPTITSLAVTVTVGANVEGKGEWCSVGSDGKWYSSPGYKEINPTACINALLANTPGPYANPAVWMRLMAKIKGKNACIAGFWEPVKDADWSWIDWDDVGAKATFNCTQLVVPP